MNGIAGAERTDADASAGVYLAARYAFPPNTCGYCGESSFRDALVSYLHNCYKSERPSPSALEQLKEELKGFRAHHAYLVLIAAENKLDPFDVEVVRAFWTGNELLENVSSESLRKFIKNDLFAGKQRRRAKELSENLPVGLLPHHSFNSLYIHFVTEKVKRCMENYDSCCVTLGTVLSVCGKTVRVERQAITLESEPNSTSMPDSVPKICLRPQIDTIQLELGSIQFTEDLAPGDILSIHWGMAIEKLTKENAYALKKYTLKNIDALNRTAAATLV